jgi:hypothetical protein
MPRMKAHGERLQHAVLATLSYTHQFQYPLSTRQVWRRLISYVAKESEVKIALKVLVKAGKVQQDARTGWWQLSTAYSLSRHRLRGQRRGRYKVGEVRRVCQVLGAVPWVEAVLVTGSLAMGVAAVNDDVDFCLIVRPKRLWLTRALVGIWATLMGKRRSWRGEEPNSWCFNLWLDTDHLRVEPQDRSLYSAYEVTQAKWVWERGGWKERWLAENGWVKNWLPQAEVESRAPQRHAESSSNFLLDWLDHVSFRLQWWYMRPHHTRERVERGAAFFHPRDTRKNLETTWQNILGNYLAQ